MQRTGTENSDGKFKLHVFGVLVIWTMVSITFIDCNNNITKGSLTKTSLITNFVQRLIKPYMQSLQFSVDKPIQRSFEETPVQKAIREIVDNLRPYLQDNEKDDKARIDGSSETTIIEFLPKQPEPHGELRIGHKVENKSEKDLRTSIYRYEKIKSKIKEALERESVAEKTKKMVTRTLDSLIARVIGNQCTWKSVDHSLAVFRNGKNSKHNITLKEWEDLKKQYLSFLQRQQLKKSLSLFNDFHQFFSNVINETQSLSKKYKIKCQLIKVGAVNKTSIVKETERAQNNCEDFKVCSGELKDFLLDFYKSLNDTTVSVFQNYAAMYTRDVITDGEESKDIDSVPNLLNNMGTAVDRRVSKVFIYELKKLRLDKQKNTEANIKVLREFVRVTCNRVQKHVKKHLASGLVSLGAKLLLTVKQDIIINLGLDLGNLEVDIKGRICTVFVTCNGKVIDNRKKLSDSRKQRLKNSVYVKIQLSLDDKLKDAIVRTNKGLLRSLNNKLLNNNQYRMDLRRNYNDVDNYYPAAHVYDWNDMKGPQYADGSDIVIRTTRTTAPTIVTRTTRRYT